jgi:hypothetical protein
MMKKYQVLSLVVSGAMIFSIAGFGCKKAEQPAEAPKQVEQAKQEIGPVDGFKVAGGTFEKGNLGFVLSADKDKMATAIKKATFKNTLHVKCKMSSPAVAGPRNGFIIFGDGSDQAKVGILVGARQYIIDGSMVKEVKELQKFDPNKVFELDITADLKKKTLVVRVDGHEMKTSITKVPASISYVGYATANAKTEFSDLQISGD